MISFFSVIWLSRILVKTNKNSFCAFCHDCNWRHLNSSHFSFSTFSSQKFVHTSTQASFKQIYLKFCKPALIAKIIAKLHNFNLNLTSFPQTKTAKRRSDVFELFQTVKHVWNQSAIIELDEISSRKFIDSRLLFPPFSINKLLKASRMDRFLVDDDDCDRSGVAPASFKASFFYPHKTTQRMPTSREHCLKFNHTQHEWKHHPAEALSEFSTNLYWQQQISFIGEFISHTVNWQSICITNSQINVYYKNVPTVSNHL